MTDNAFQQMLKDNPRSKYRLLKALDNLADMKPNLRTFKIPICNNGCEAFYKENADSTTCNHCSLKRWKHCGEECNDENDIKM
jgi:hypothetical protein